MTEAARNALITSALHLPQITARKLVRFVPDGLEFADIVGAGNLGLCKAAETFDPAHGASFQTWAITKIRGQILEYIREQDFYSRSYRDQIRRGEKPEIQFVSLQQPALSASDPNRGTLRVEDVHADAASNPEECAMDAACSQEIARCVARLPEREQDVLRRYYCQRQTFKEIGEHLGISESRAFQIHRHAIERMRAHGSMQALFQ